jgi:hypothetical protein
MERDRTMADAEQAFIDLYDSAVQVVDVSNPDLKAQRHRMSLLLDKWERLRHELYQRSVIDQSDAR